MRRTATAPTAPYPNPFLDCLPVRPLVDCPAMPKKLIESLIFTIRGRKVILDADLARIYGVPTFRFNEAFKRNRRRFPADFAFQLTERERRNLASQIAASAFAERYQ